ncbi:MAG: Gfo/Idh/MocA family oxidoreductase [Bacteroidales bacterium]|nr:Gfo/Idh/MocA family oxidoreductase [Bacteroidales bacterium]
MRKVRFGIVGTGRISDWVLKGAVLEPRFEAVAVCSRTPEKAEAFALKHGIPNTFTDIDRMASDPSVDAVYIGTPNDTHHDIAIRCMDHGKHVLCEKPLASNALEVREMIAAAKRNGVVLMEAMISTLSPNFRMIQEKLGTLGKPLHYSGTFCQFSSKHDKLQAILAGKDPGPVPSSFNPDCSGGALMDIGIYPIYPMVTLFGKPKGVKADVTTLKVPVSDGSMKAIDIQGIVLFGYDGMSAQAMYSKIADSRLRTEISCEGGILSLDQIHITRQVDFIPCGAPTSGRSSGPAVEDITVPCDPDEYLCEFREFIDVLESGRLESVNNCLGNSLAVAETMDEIRRQGGIVFPADPIPLP